MKKDKEWLKEEIKKLITEESQYMPHGEMVDLGLVLLTIDQLDEPKKPVIPQFIANWIESYRKKTLVELINDAVYSSDEDSECFRRWFHEEMGFESNYSEFLSRVWLDGFTVEKEQKYNVTFKVKSSFGTVGIFLYKKGDEVLAGDNFKAYYPKEDECRLTEQEIRGFQNGDILFEHFAVKIEELEEC